MLRALKSNNVGDNKKPQSAEDEFARHQIFLTLQRAMMSRVRLEVRLQGDDAIYQSIILEVDSDEGTILIDELFPSTYAGVAGQWMTVAIRQQNGRFLRFNATILQRHSYDDAPIYVISMPDDLNQDQRRGCFRLPIDSGIVVQSHFVAPDYCHHSGQLLNLSSSGLCLATNPDDALTLNYDDVLKDLVFTYAGVEVECEARVKNIITDAETLRPVKVGAQFQQLSVAERRQLDKLILQMQREYLRSRSVSQETLFH